MLTQSNNPNVPTNARMLSLNDLTKILIKHYDIHEGFYEVGIQFNIAVGSVGPKPSDVAPGAVLTVGGVALSRTNQDSPLCIDASTVNPLLPTPFKKSVKIKAAK